MFYHSDRNRTRTWTLSYEAGEKDPGRRSFQYFDGEDATSDSLCAAEVWRRKQEATEDVSKTADQGGLAMG